MGIINILEKYWETFSGVGGHYLADGLTAVPDEPMHCLQKKNWKKFTTIEMNFIS
ncbi:MAG: hypothetical protein ACLUOI_28450 [Eisenbergiella sp.]